MIIVTGAAGFIGSCLIAKLNELNFNYIIAVDDFSNEEKNKKYLVIEIKGKTYVVDSNEPRRVYHYRNPHQFKYFSK